jgi:hypothetical protein
MPETPNSLFGKSQIKINRTPCACRISYRTVFSSGRPASRPSRSGMASSRHEGTRDTGRVSSPTVTPFVARAADRDRLSAVIRQVRDGLGLVLVLSGDAGSDDAVTGLGSGQRRGCPHAPGIRLRNRARPWLCGLAEAAPAVVGYLADLPDPQWNALGSAFGLISGPAPNRFLIGLGTTSVQQEGGGKSRCYASWMTLTGSSRKPRHPSVRRSPRGCRRLRHNPGRPYRGPHSGRADRDPRVPAAADVRP